MSPGTLLVVGAGQAGFQAAASAREEGYDGRIILVGEEPGLPYQRPPLSKAYLSGKADAKAVRLRPERFFTEHRIELRAGERAARIDRAARRVALDSGEALPYDHLVLALGSRNRRLPVPGADLDGVAQLRTLEDAEDLRRRLDAARDGAVVVGAGFIGLEFAAAAAARGIGVTVIEAADRPMARSVSAAMSGFFRDAHERQGVRFAFGATVVRVIDDGAGKASGVETADGRRFPAGLVLVGIGVVPNSELAAEAGLETADGVAVDEFLTTSDPAVSAIGDCACHPHRAHDGTRRVRIESVQNAVDQARCVAARLAGKRPPASYAAVPWFWSDQGAHKLQIAGLATPHDEAVARGDAAQGSFSVFCYRGGRLLGVESANRPLDHVLARKILASGADLAPDLAADPGFDLKGFAAAATGSGGA